MRSSAVKALGSSFYHAPDKQQAWNDLQRLTNDEESYVRSNAAEALGSAFALVPNEHKEQAWTDLQRLTNDEDNNVRSKAASSLGSTFFHVTDKRQAWNDLRRLTKDENSLVRSNATKALGSAFAYVPDKQQAWNELIRLACDPKSDVNSSATSALYFAYSYVPDKQQAWNELIKLTNDEDSFVRSKVAKFIDLAFSQVPDKQQAWNELHKLTNDKSSFVRFRAAEALGSAFYQIPDKFKQQALDDLIKLTIDEYNNVRASSNHSLGRVSIFIASQAETDEDYKKELEKAIKFFETATQEAAQSNPAQFCLPFYRSFHTIIFKTQEAKDEVDKYLEEAKAAIKGSESKKQLFEDVENLAEALKEVQNLENLDLKAMKGEPNFYRKYCEQAAEIMKCTNEKAPFVTEVLRKGLPILDRNLKEIIEEIQHKTEIISEQTKGTLFEELGEELHRNSSCLLPVRDIIGFNKQVHSLETKLSLMCSKLPESQKGEACELIETLLKEDSVEDKMPLINDILSKFSYQIDMISCFNRIEARLDNLDCIRFDVFRLKLNTGNVISNLDDMKIELKKMNGAISQNMFSMNKFNSIHDDKLTYLKNEISERLNDMEGLIKSLPNNRETQEILDKLNELKQSDSDTLLQRSSGITTLISFFVMFAQLYQQYIL